MPSFSDLPHPFDRESEHIFPLNPSSSHHGGYAKTRHGETCLDVASINETFLHHASHDETPHEESSRDETFPNVIRHSGTPPGETYWAALRHGSFGFFLGLCSRYPSD